LAPGNFAKKMPFAASQAVFRSPGHCVAKRIETVQNVVYKSSTTLAFLPDAKLQLSKFGQAQKAKFRVFFREIFPAASTFIFRFLSSPLLSLFFPRFFFFCWAFTRLPFGGKRFGKKPEDREFF